MKVARCSIFVMAISLAGFGRLSAEDEAVHVNVSDYRITQPLEFRVADFALQDAAPPNGISPSDIVPEPKADDAAGVEAAGGERAMLVDACYCGPRWTVAVDAVYLNRTTEDRELQYYNASGAAAGVAPDFDYELGYRVGAVYCRPCGDDIEISYMSVDNWSGASSGAGGAFEFGFEFFGIDLGDVEAFRNRYESDLDSLEINFQRCCGNVTLIYGVHYLDIGESLYIEQEYFTGFEELVSNTSNRLYGLQVGAQGCVYQCCNFSVDMGGKVGGYLNDHEVFAYWSDQDAYFVDSDQDFAFVGQANITARYRVRDCVSIRGGYQMMFISDVADAVSQLNSIDLAVDPTEGRIATDDVVFHGFFLGVEVSR